LGSGKKKIKIEVEDAEGDKYNLSLEGNMSKEKVMKVMQLMDSINNEKSQPTEYNYHTSNQMQENTSSLSSKIWSIVENKFPFTSFTSTDILEMYTDEYNEPIKLDVVATYLGRYHKKEKLLRSKGGKEWIYKVYRHSELNQASALDKHRSAVHGFESPYKDLHVKDLNN
jgi:hypothetical protein